MPSRLSTLGLATATAAALLTAGCGLTGESSSTSESYDVSGDIRTINLHAQAGTVEVVAVASGVRVTERREYSGAAPKTSHRTENGTLYLADDGCDTQLRFRKDCDTHYRVEAPAGVTLKIESNAAPVTITGMTGALDITTNVGGITGTGLAGETQIRSNVGDLDLRYGSAPARVDATNDVGSTTLHLPSAATYRFEVKVDVGATTIDLPNKPEADHRVKVTSNVGDITVRAA